MKHLPFVVIMTFPFAVNAGGRKAFTCKSESGITIEFQHPVPDNNCQKGKLTIKQNEIIKEFLVEKTFTKSPLYEKFLYSWVDSQFEVVKSVLIKQEICDRNSCDSVGLPPLVSLNGLLTENGNETIFTCK